MFAKTREFCRDLRVHYPLLRCVFGVTFALMVSTTMGYLTPHITAIFALMFLSPNQKPMGLKKELGMVIALAIMGYFGIILGKYLIDYPLVLLPLLGLIIFWSFRLVKIPEAVRLLFLMLAILIPFISLKANILGNVVLAGMLVNLIIALLVVRVAYFIFPTTPLENTVTESKKPVSYKNVNMNTVAFNGLIVLFPVVFVFYLYNATTAVLTLVFATLLCFDPFIYQSKKGTVLIVANLFGGLAGILAYNVLVIAPSYVLYLFLILSVAFYFVPHIFSGKKTAPVFRISFNTFFVVMGIISTSTNEAGDTIWERVVQIGLAIIYVIVAFKVVNTFNNPKLADD